MRSLLTIAIATALVVGLAPSAMAQSGPTLEQFVVRANRIPMNPLGALRPDAHRLKSEGEAAFGVVNTEVRAARAAGRRPPACPPERISVNPQQLLGFLNAIPQTRRTRMTVPDGIREWMADRYPCPQG